VLLGLSVALLLVVLVGTAVGLRKTDIHLTARVQDAADIGGPRLTAHVDGRDAYLTGRGTESDLVHALALTAGIPGLRAVHTEVQIVTARTDLQVDPEAVEPSVTVVLDDGRITLRGLVADDGSHASIVAAAEAAVGTDRVRDRLRETRAVKSAVWLEEVAPAIAAVASFSHVTLAFGNGRVLVTGAVATADVRARVADALQSAGIEAIVDSLTVTAPQHAWLSIERTPAGITLTGLVGREQLDSVLAAIEATYGPIPTTREALVLASNTVAVEWPDQIAELIPSTFALDPWKIRADGGEVSLFGVTSDPAAPARVEAVADRWGGNAVATDLRLTPAAVVSRLETKVIGLEWFEGRGVSLTSEAMLALNEVALVLFENPDVAISVVGHPARSKDIATDREDGLLRAGAVRSYVVSRGIDPARVDTAGSADAVTVDGVVVLPAIAFVLAGAGSAP
jgi:osmotically-inducible protein OsmY